MPLFTDQVQEEEGAVLRKHTHREKATVKGLGIRVQVRERAKEPGVTFQGWAVLDKRLS